MEITIDKLIEWDVCGRGYKWFCRQELTDHEAVCKKLCEEGYWEWAYWVITEILKDDKISLVKFSVYAAEQVLPIFEEAFPDDDRPKEVIEAIKEYIDNPSNINIDADAIYAVNAANYAANAANYAAANAADTADYAANAANYAANAAVNNNEIKINIVKYGLSLIDEKK